MVGPWWYHTATSVPSAHPAILTIANAYALQPQTTSMRLPNHLKARYSQRLSPKLPVFGYLGR